MESAKFFGRGASSLGVALKGWLAGSIFLVLMVGGSGDVLAQAAGGGLESDWVNGHASRVRLVAGRKKGAAADAETIIAGVEIELDPGWKTYWRNPGDAGGVPPRLDFSKSSNVGETKVLYPAPKRLTDKSGETIGYKGFVVFPVKINPADRSKPVDVKVDFEFGVCADICIPAQAELSLTIPNEVSASVSDDVIEAMARVPRNAEDRQAGDPKLVASSIVLEGEAPRIVLDVDFPGGAKKGDVFGEAAPGIYLPMAHRSKEATGDERMARFVIDLREAFDVAELKGQTVTLTMVGPQGQSERQLVLK